MTNANAINVAAALVEAGITECRIVPLSHDRWGLDIYAVAGSRLCRVTKAHIVGDEPPKEKEG